LHGHRQGQRQRRRQHRRRVAGGQDQPQLRGAGPAEHEAPAQQLAPAPAQAQIAQIGLHALRVAPLQAIDAPALQQRAARVVDDQAAGAGLHRPIDRVDQQPVLSLPGRQCADHRDHGQQQHQPPPATGATRRPERRLRGRVRSVGAQKLYPTEKCARTRRSRSP
jgi:hypothetical protein